MGELIGLIGGVVIVGGVLGFILFKLIARAKERKADRLLAQGSQDEAIALYRELITDNLSRLERMLTDFSAGRSQSAGNAVRVFTGPLCRHVQKLESAGSLDKTETSSLIERLKEIENTGSQYSVKNMSKEDAKRSLEICELVKAKALETDASVKT